MNHMNGNNNNWTWGDILCDSDESDGQVKPCPKGYYCPGYGALPQKCPDGLTTKRCGATEEGHCIFTANEMVLTDSAGTLTLPAGLRIM
jgi:hypothetical protein